MVARIRLWLRDLSSRPLTEQSRCHVAEDGDYNEIFWDFDPDHGNSRSWLIDTPFNKEANRKINKAIQSHKLIYVGVRVRARDAALAPPGGIEIGRNYFSSGEVIPTTVLLYLTPTERARLNRANASAEKNYYDLVFCSSGGDIDADFWFCRSFADLVNARNFQAWTDSMIQNLNDHPVPPLNRPKANQDFAKPAF